MTANVRFTVRAPIAPLHEEPRVSSAQVSQRLAGHEVEVLSRDDDWLRVRGDDGYEGWLHRGYLAAATVASEVPPRERLRTSLGCTVRRAESGDRASMPLGAYLAEDDVIESGEALGPALLRRVFPLDAGTVASTALERFEGTPYQWGGITPWGADCSGFVQSVLVLHGMPMARDAWQQAERGEPVQGELAALRPADLLFFSDREDRRITHVGMAVGPMRMVHVALGRGGYAVEQLDDADDGYVRALRDRFLFARRLPELHESAKHANLVLHRA